ncbi:hypothetical protein ACKI1J_14915 [Streptomyces scabiei]|uniref:hypothetical protein n=1 Tax=Streptomyces scabiei TaxID=1930 RepID=UPI0038F7596F
MAKSWKPSEAKKFAKHAQLGKTYYVIYDMATNLAPYEDAKTYSEFTFTRRAPFTGNLMTDGGTSAEGLCLRYGPVYDAPPQGLRNIAGPAPQVAGPLGGDYEGILDEAELRGLDKLNGRNLPAKLRRPLNARRP